ncbi:MAG TPA: hypothetical protein VN875_04815 [Candidatus Binatus sp.]|jgi:hypothetical protein|nr:hypothetical protein [Candidatus Binatus sp.]
MKKCVLFFEFSVVTAHLDGKAARAYPPPLLIVHFIQDFFYFVQFGEFAAPQPSRPGPQHRLHQRADYKQRSNPFLGMSPYIPKGEDFGSPIWMMDQC